MGDYSREPPRRDCLLHLGFGEINDDRVIDLSPQQNDGKIVGDPALETGAIGKGFYFDGESGVEVPLDVGDVTNITLSAWVKFGEEERGDSSNLGNPILAEDAFTATLFADAQNDKPEVRFFIYPSDASSATNIAASVTRGEWHHVAGVREGSDVVLYVDGERRASGSTTTGTLQSTTTYYVGKNPNSADLEDSTVDDARIYRVAFGAESIRDLYSLGAAHTAVDEMAEAWDNPGVPFRGNNQRLAGALSEEKERVQRTLDFIREARHIDDAGGEQLDAIGEVAGIHRRENEGDDQFRARIKARIAAGRSSGTFEDLLEVTATIIDASKDRVELQTNFDTHPATAFIYVRTSDIEDSPLTPSDLTTLLKDLVLAGHDVEVVQQGATPFEVTSDSLANDPEKGLTSDSISTGGGLVSDV